MRFFEQDLRLLPGISVKLDESRQLCAISSTATRITCWHRLVEEADEAILTAFQGSALGLSVVESAQKGFRFYSSMMADLDWYIPADEFQSWVE